MMNLCGALCSNNRPCELLLGHNKGWKHSNQWCAHCGQEKKKYSNGFCQKCGVSRSKKWRKFYPEQCRLYGQKYVVRAHSITLEDKQKILELQNHICPICLRPLNGFKINIDHFHGCSNLVNHYKEIGKSENTYGCPQCIRGILCVQCNQSILPYLEQFVHLQNKLIKEYLARRPLNVRL